MKIILSESQIIRILQEQTVNPKHQKYIDWILDKISSGGIESLSDEERTDLDKMSRGENPIETDEPEAKTSVPDEISTNESSGRYEDFMQSFPDKYNFTVDNEDWYVVKDLEPHGEFDVLMVSNDKILFMIHPFTANNEFEVVTSMSSFKFHIKKLPKNYDEMETFVKQFLESDLFGIVKYIKKKQ